MAERKRVVSWKISKTELYQFLANQFGFSVDLIDKLEEDRADSTFFRLYFKEVSD